MGFTALLTAGMAAGTFPGPATSVLASFFIDDFGISRSQIGWLVTLFAVVGATLSPMVGRLSDTIGGRTMLSATFAAGGLGVLGMALSPSYGWLLFVAVVAGIVWAGANPSTNKLVASYILPGRRGLIMGVKQSGVQAGLLLAGALLPTGAVTLGWRPTLAIAGMMILVVGLVTFVLLPQDPRPQEFDVSGEGSEDPAGVGWLAVYAFLMAAGMAAVMSYLPLYAQEETGFAPTTAGGVAAVVGFVGVGARILWSRQSEGVGHFSRPLLFISLVAVAATVAIWSASVAGGWLVWLGAIAAGAGVVAWNSVVMLAVVSRAGNHHAGRISGRVHFGFLSGFAVSPVVFGYSVDATSTYLFGWAAVASVFVLAAVVMWLWGRETGVGADLEAGG